MHRLSNSAAGNPGPLVDMNVPEQTHTIIDGDTLQSLSQQYLGRADRYLELFQYNRDVLRNPDVLADRGRAANSFPCGAAARH